MTIDEILDARQEAGLRDVQELQRMMAEAQAQAEMLLDDLCFKMGVQYRWYKAQAVSINGEGQS